MTLIQEKVRLQVMDSDVESFTGMCAEMGMSHRGTNTRLAIMRRSVNTVNILYDKYEENGNLFALGGMFAVPMLDSLFSFWLNPTVSVLDKIRWGKGIITAASNLFT